MTAWPYSICVRKLQSAFPVAGFMLSSTALAYCQGSKWADRKLTFRSKAKSRAFTFELKFRVDATRIVKASRMRPMNGKTTSTLAVRAISALL